MADVKLQIVNLNDDRYGKSSIQDSFIFCQVSQIHLKLPWEYWACTFMHAQPGQSHFSTSAKCHATAVMLCRELPWKPPPYKQLCNE